jgi:hypothetical protein
LAQSLALGDILGTKYRTWSHTWKHDGHLNL